MPAKAACCKGLNDVSSYQSYWHSCKGFHSQEIVWKHNVLLTTRCANIKFVKIKPPHGHIEKEKESDPDCCLSGSSSRSVKVFGNTLFCQKTQRYVDSNMTQESNAKDAHGCFKVAVSGWLLARIDFAVDTAKLAPVISMAEDVPPDNNHLQGHTPNLSLTRLWLLGEHLGKESKKWIRDLLRSLSSW